MYATPAQLRELLGEGFAAVEDATLTEYLAAAEEELRARLCLLLAEVPVELPPPLLVRLTLYRAAAEVIAVYYGSSGAGVEDGRQEFFTDNYTALLGLRLSAGRGTACWHREDSEQPTDSHFRRLTNL